MDRQHPPESIARAAINAPSNAGGSNDPSQQREWQQQYASVGVGGGGGVCHDEEEVRRRILTRFLNNVGDESLATAAAQIIAEEEHLHFKALIAQREREAVTVIERQHLQLQEHQHAAAVANAVAGAPGLGFNVGATASSPDPRFLLALQRHAAQGGHATHAMAQAGGIVPVSAAAPSASLAAAAGMFRGSAVAQPSAAAPMPNPLGEAIHVRDFQVLQAALLAKGYSTAQAAAAAALAGQADAAFERASQSGTGSISDSPIDGGGGRGGCGGGGVSGGGGGGSSSGGTEALNYLERLQAVELACRRLDDVDDRRVMNHFSALSRNVDQGVGCSGGAGGGGGSGIGSGRMPTDVIAIDDSSDEEEVEEAKEPAAISERQKPKKKDPNETPPGRHITAAPEQKRSDKGPLPSSSERRGLESTELETERAGGGDTSALSFMFAPKNWSVPLTGANSVVVEGGARESPQVVRSSNDRCARAAAQATKNSTNDHGGTAPTVANTIVNRMHVKTSPPAGSRITPAAPTPPSYKPQPAAVATCASAGLPASPTLSHTNKKRLPVSSRKKEITKSKSSKDEDGFALTLPSPAASSPSTPSLTSWPPFSALGGGLLVKGPKAAAGASAVAGAGSVRVKAAAAPLPPPPSRKVKMGISLGAMPSSAGAPAVLAPKGTTAAGPAKRKTRGPPPAGSAMQQTAPAVPTAVALAAIGRASPHPRRGTLLQALVSPPLAKKARMDDALKGGASGLPPNGDPMSIVAALPVTPVYFQPASNPIAVAAGDCLLSPPGGFGTCGEGPSEVASAATATAGGVLLPSVFGTAIDSSPLADLRVDPTFIRMIVSFSNDALLDDPKRSVCGDSKKTVRQEPLLGTFVRGMLNTDDKTLKSDLEDGNDLSVRMCAAKISAGLGIPGSKRNTWATTVSVSSESLSRLAKTIVFQRRKGMKSAVDIAFGEMKKKHEALMTSLKDHYESINSEKDEKIKKLKSTLNEEKVTHVQQIKALEEIHIADMNEAENEHKEFVTQLVKSQRGRNTKLQEKLDNNQMMHQRVLDSYVEASSDTLRMLRESDSPPMI